MRTIVNGLRANAAAFNDTINADALAVANEVLVVEINNHSDFLRTVERPPRKDETFILRAMETPRLVSRHPRALLMQEVCHQRDRSNNDSSRKAHPLEVLQMSTEVAFCTTDKDHQERPLTHLLRVQRRDGALLILRVSVHRSKSWGLHSHFVASVRFDEHPGRHSYRRAGSEFVFDYRHHILTILNLPHRP